MMRVQVMMVGMVQNFIRHFGTPAERIRLLSFQELLAHVSIGLEADLIDKNRLFESFFGLFSPFSMQSPVNIFSQLS